MATLRPIGIVRNGIKAPSLRATRDGLSLGQRMEEFRARHRRTREMVSRLVLDERFEALLEGLDGFSHILVLYWPHLVAEERRDLQLVHPMGCTDIPKQGVLATCSPARPNPILVTACRLLGIEKATLSVQGLEAVDGSPILDIKPYNPGYYRVESPTVPPWMEALRDGLAEENDPADTSPES
ncbi:MAG: S-adenosylmethionine-dependent methyltransferase [Deltaproteobacteria bacterium]|nr:S-adenosylmethionine-dependent methyltransferase [Deltaproteobacteria bacterium]